MANIFYCETDIEACNLKLLDTFAKYAATGETVKVSDIIAYYAYDVLYATTTGRQPGFLGRPMHMRKVTSALESWKSYGVLYGSYLRFRPFLDAAYKKLGLAGNAKDHISEDFDIDDDHPKHLLRKGSDEPKHARDMFDPCVAMILAGSDPVITHLLTSLFYIYRDPELLQRLRHEIKRSGIWQPPRLKFLMRSKARMPLLHAVLQETLRLHQPQTTGFSYIASEGGVLIEGKHVPEGVSLSIVIRISMFYRLHILQSFDVTTLFRWHGGRSRNLVLKGNLHSPSAPAASSKKRHYTTSHLHFATLAHPNTFNTPCTAVLYMRRYSAIVYHT